MKNRKWIPILLLLVVAAVLAVALFALNRTDAAAEEDTGIALSTMESASVDAFSYQTAQGTSVSLTKKDNVWTLDSDTKLPISSSTVDAMVSGFTGLEALRNLGSEVDTTEFGFDAPTFTVTAKAGDAVFSVTAGSENAVTGNTYARVEGSADVYTITTASLSDLCKSVSELYAAQSATEIAKDDITVMTVQTGSDTLRFTQQDGVWTLEDDPNYALEQSLVNLMANTVCSLQSSWSITAPGSDSEYGLDAPNAIVTLATADGQSAQVTFGGLDPEDNDSCYYRVASAPGVVFEGLANNLNAYVYTKDSLAASTAETAATATPEEPAADYPVGAQNAFAAN